MRSGPWIIVVLLVLTGCGSGDDEPMAPPTADASADVGPDGAVDGPDAEADDAADALPDRGPDGSVDVGADDDADLVDGMVDVDATVDAAAAPDARPDLDAADDADGAIELDAADDADGAIEPDAAEPDAAVEPDVAIDPDAAPEPDAAVDPEPDAAIEPEPDAAIEPEPDCRVDADCPDDFECVGGLCLPPLDGTCEGPYVGEVGGAYEGMTGGLGIDGGSCPGNNDLTAPEAIYRVVFPADGPYCINTRDSLFDTMLYVRTRCGDPRSEVACRDDDFEINGPGGWAVLTLEAEARRAYYITVDGYGSVGEAPREGIYRLTITAGACQPPPECQPETEEADCGPGRRCVEGACADCGDDGDCPGGRCVDGVCVGCADDGDCPAGGRCVDAICEVDVGPSGDCVTPVVAAPGVRYLGETAGEGVSAGSCGALNGAVDAPEAVFAFTAPRAGPWCATTAGSALDTVLYVRRDCADAASELGCSDDAFDLTGGPQGALTFEADVGEAVSIVVDGFALPGVGEAGAFRLRVTEGACAAP